MNALKNAYASEKLAEIYASLDVSGTYYLAFRDLPGLFARHVTHGKSVLDFGCGTGRSSRFLRNCGFEVTGADISSEMLARARALDPGGDYRLLSDGSIEAIGTLSFDLILCAFPLDNVPNARKAPILEGLRSLLKPGGRIVIVGSPPDSYLNDWVSFSTTRFPQNRLATDGDLVRSVIVSPTGTSESEPIEDVLCSESCYRAIFQKSGLALLETLRPLGRADEPFAWVNEHRIAPWIIFTLEKAT